MNYLKPIKILQHIKFLCLLITLINSSINFSAQEIDLKNNNSIEGKWEGNIVINEQKSVGILWNFKIPFIF